MLLSSSLRRWIEEEEVPLRERLDKEFQKKKPMDQAIVDTQVYWFKNETGFDNLSYQSFLNKWLEPDGQYKNFSVILQLLTLIPESQRKQSQGAIIGAKMMVGSGQWIPFLMDVMLEMGFTGVVTLYDLGLENKTEECEELKIVHVHGYYAGKDHFTWAVDDTFESGRPGTISYTAEFLSYKCHVKEEMAYPQWFHSAEGRFFLIGKERKKAQIDWPWQKGQCPCDRCCFEAQFSEVVQMKIRFFEGHCRPGVWAHTRRIVSAVSSGNSFEPETGQAKAAALMVANQLGLASGQKCIQPYQGDLAFEDNDFQGPPPVTQAVFSKDKAPRGEEGLHREVRAHYISDELQGVAAEYVYLPEAYYPELEATALVRENKRGYRRPDLPSAVVEESGGGRQKDPYGRRYVGNPCTAGEMWCWQEKQIVKTPHLCPLGCGRRHKIWRGYCTSYKHPDQAKDLCSRCDRSVTSYFHRCNSYVVFFGISKKEAVSNADSLAYDMCGKWPWLPSWSEEEEKMSFSKRRKEGLVLGRDHVQEKN